MDEESSKIRCVVPGSRCRDWIAHAGTAPARWLVQMRTGGVWSMQAAAGRKTTLATGQRSVYPKVNAVSGLDRAGNVGSSTVLQRAVK